MTHDTRDLCTDSDTGNRFDGTRSGDGCTDARLLSLSCVEGDLTLLLSSAKEGPCDEDCNHYGNGNPYFLTDLLHIFLFYLFTFLPLFYFSTLIEFQHLFVIDGLVLRLQLVLLGLKQVVLAGQQLHDVLQT